MNPLTNIDICIGAKLVLALFSVLNFLELVTDSVLNEASDPA